MSGPLLPLPGRLLVLLRARAKSLSALLGIAGGFAWVLHLSGGGAPVDGAGIALRIVALGGAMILGVPLVSEDFRTGSVQIWLQRPVHPLRFYLARLGEAWAALSALLLMLVLCLRIAASVLGWEGADRILEIVPRLLLEGAAVLSLSFAVSAWAPAGGLLLVFALVVAGTVLDDTLALRPEVMAQPWRTLLRAFSHPHTALESITRFASGAAPSLPWDALGRILSYCMLWIALALAGLRRTVAHGGLAAAQGD